MKKKVLALILMTKCIIVFAQENNNYTPKIIPPSPSATQLQKYGDYPVGNYTGIPDINIPIYTIDNNGMQIPISISYHSSGVKPNDPSGAVGVGWTLNAGGMVSRTIKGQADDQRDFPSASRFMPFYTATQLNSLTIEQRDYLFFHNLSNLESYDSEPDIFSFSFLGHQGKFVLKTDSTRKPILFPHQPFVITHDISFPVDVSTTMKKITIKDSQGFTYYFGKSLDNSEQAVEYNQNYNASTGWFLTDITSPVNKDVIKIKYQLSDVEISSTRVDSRIIDDRAEECFIFRQCYGLTEVERNKPFREAVRIAEVVGQGTISSSYSENRYTTYFPKEITFTNGKVKFIPNATTKMLQSIEVYDSNNNLIKVVDFTLIKADSRYFLKEVSFNDNLKQKKEDYKFDYEGINWSNITPTRPTNSMETTDYWGYRNGVTNPSVDVLPAWLSSQSNSCSGYGGYIGTFQKLTNPGQMKMYILKRISYPTGGYTDFDFEANQHESIKMVGPEINQSIGDISVGGLRIKQITNYSSSGVVANAKTYEYKFGYMEVVPTKDKFVYQQVSCFMPGPNEVFSRFYYSSEPLIDLAPFGSPVVYGEVIEYSHNDTNSSIGKTVYNYDVNSNIYDKFNNNGEKDYSYNDIKYKIYQKEIKPWNSGQLSIKSAYKYENSQYKLVSVENYSYKEQIIENVRGLTFYPFFFWQPDGCGTGFQGTSCPLPEQCNIRKAYTSGAGLYSYWNYADYNIISGVKQLEEVNKKIFD